MPPRTGPEGLRYRPKEVIRTPEGMWSVKPEVAKFLIGAAVYPRAYGNAFAVTNDNSQAISDALLQTRVIDLRPITRDVVVHGRKRRTEKEAQPVLLDLLSGMIRERRSTENGDIDMPGLAKDLSGINFRINSPVYAAMALAILHLPDEQRRRVIDDVVEAARFAPRKEDRGMFARLSGYAAEIHHEEREARAAQTAAAYGKGGVQRERPGRRGLLSRRGLLAGAGAAAVLGFGAWWLSDQGGSPEGNSLQEAESFRKPFGDNKEANETAEKLGITAGSFFYFRPDDPNYVSTSSREPIFQNIAIDAATTGFLANVTLLPIYPPAVIEQQDALSKAAQAEGVPINILGTIASIESAGQTTAKSGKDAVGLMQIDAGYNLDKVVQAAQELGIPIKNADADLEKWLTLLKQSSDAAVTYGNGLSAVRTALENPLLSARVGAKIVKEYYGDVVKAHPSYDPNNPVTWSLALGCYNGGPGVATENYNNQLTETQLYQVHALRFFMTAEIAAQLRYRGINDPDIAKQLVSEEVDARAYAYSENDNGISTITDYQNVWIPLSQDPINAQGDPQLTSSLQHAYNTYIGSSKGNYPFHVPLSPGLRLWVENGGLDQFESVDPNNHLNNYPSGTYIS